MNEIKPESNARPQPAASSRANALGANFANTAGHGDAIEIAGVTLRAVCRSDNQGATAVVIEAAPGKGYPTGPNELRRLAAALLGVAEILEIRIPAPPLGQMVAQAQRRGVLGAEESAA